MQRVMTRIAARSAEFARSPMLAYLRDASVPTRQRLRFLPYATHFVMAFRDLCALLLPSDDRGDPCQAMLNALAREDDGHWRWFIADLAALEHDRTLRLSEAIEFIWSDATTQTRLLSYTICAQAMGASPTEKLVLVQCVEACFRQSAGALGALAEAFRHETGKRLGYVGPRHVEAEAQHTEDPAVLRGLAAMELSDEAAARTLAIVERTFDAFTRFHLEMLALVARA